ncbi:hypothetical protein F5Y08DRAFT_341615 [Xylaria arbuscula]|nr:hypothetical protein F5Y08DRAFT_341615 [Xylaria arbuscula]
MSDRYRQLTALLRRHDIPYLEGGNTGFFVWAHLIQQDPKAVPKVKEELLRQCQQVGIFIRDRGKYLGEEPEDGWFRITFTLDAGTLDVGWERLAQCLQAMKLL